MEINCNNYPAPRKVVVDGRGEMRFHSWVSRHTMCFIGYNANRGYALEVSVENVYTKDGVNLRIEKPYELTLGPILKKLLNDVGINVK